MKKYLKIVFVSLLVVSTMGKGARASSAKMSKEEIDMRNLRNIKASIATLCGPLDTPEDREKQEIAKRNLEKASRVPSAYPIIKAAFEDGERESGMIRFTSDRAKEIWWRNLHTLKEMYLKK